MLSVSVNRFIAITFGVFALLLVFLGLAQDVLAQGGGGTVADECENIHGVTRKIVGCIQFGLERAAQEYFQELYPKVKKIIQVSMTFAVVLYGALLATGSVDKPNRDTFVLILKIAFVMYFSANMEDWYDDAMNIIEDLVSLVTGYGQGGDSFGCLRSNDVWWRVDCMIDVLIGTDFSGQYQGLSRGLVAFFFRTMFSSVLGFVIGLLGFYVIFGTVLALARTLQTYLAALIGITFMLMMAPIFMPMLLFKVTFEYFEKWTRLIISMILQPVIMFAFLTVMLLALDKVFYTGEHSFMRMLFGDAVQEGFNPNEYLEQNGAFACERDNGIASFDLGYAQESGAIFKFLKDFGSQGDTYQRLGFEVEEQTDAADPTKVKYKIKMKCLDFARLLRARQPPIDVGSEWSVGTADIEDDEDASALMQQLTASGVIMMALVIFTFMTMMNYIPALARDLSGGYKQVTPLYEQVGKALPGQELVERAAGSAMSSVSGAVNGVVNRIGGLVGGR